MDILRLLPIKNILHLARIHSNTILGEDMTKKRYFFKPKLTLAELGIKTMLSKFLEDDMNMTSMIFFGLGINENIINKESLKKEIERSLNTLTERQQEVIRYFFGIGIDHPMSLEDIGERFCLTRERVRQIKDKAITKLRNASRSKLLKSYLGT